MSDDPLASAYTEQLTARNTANRTSDIDMDAGADAGAQAIADDEAAALQLLAHESLTLDAQNNDTAGAGDDEEPYSISDEERPGALLLGRATSDEEVESGVPATPVTADQEDEDEEDDLDAVADKFKVLRRPETDRTEDYWFCSQTAWNKFMLDTLSTNTKIREKAAAELRKFDMMGRVVETGEGTTSPLPCSHCVNNNHPCRVWRSKTDKMCAWCRGQKHSGCDANGKTARDLTARLAAEAANAALAPRPTTAIETGTDIGDLAEELDEAVTNIKSLVHKVKIQVKEQAEAVNAVRAAVDESARGVVLYANEAEDSAGLAAYHACLAAASAERAAAALVDVQSTAIARPVAIPVALPVGTITATPRDAPLSLDPGVAAAIMNKQPKDLHELLEHLMQTNDYLKAELKAKDNANEQRMAEQFDQFNMAFSKQEERIEAMETKFIEAVAKAEKSYSKQLYNTKSAWTEHVDEVEESNRKAIEAQQDSIAVDWKELSDSVHALRKQDKALRNDMTDVERRLDSAEDSIMRWAADSDARDALEREAAMANKTYSLFDTASEGSELGEDSEGEAADDRVGGEDGAGAEPAAEEDTHDSG